MATQNALPACGPGAHGQAPVCAWRAEPGDMSGKDLHLCVIFLTSALCFSERGKDKKGTEESHGREKAEQCIYVLSEIKSLKSKGKEN